jgi:hypothetical protein
MLTDVRPLSNDTYEITHSDPKTGKSFQVWLNIQDINYALSTLIKSPSDCKPVAVQMKVIDYQN